MSCDCRQPIEPTLPPRGTLFLRTEIDHLRVKIERALPEATVERSWLRVSGDTDALRAYVARLAVAITSVESERLHALVVADDEPLTVDRAFESMPFAVLQRRIEFDWLGTAIASRAFTTHFQPIFESSDPTRIFAREALLRLANSTAPIGHLFSVAQEIGLAPALDRVARESAIDTFAAAGFSGKLFLNFIPSSIYDPVTCLATTFAALERNGIPFNRVVMEVVESERVDDVQHLLRVLDFYRERGLAIALDDLGSGFSSLNMLGLLRPDYVKLDIALIAGIHLDPFKATLAQRLIELAKELKLAVIAEGIERPEELAWVTAQGVDYVQGFYLARPAAA